MFTSSNCTSCKTHPFHPLQQLAHSQCDLSDLSVDQFESRVSYHFPFLLTLHIRFHSFYYVPSLGVSFYGQALRSPSHFRRLVIIICVWVSTFLCLESRLRSFFKTLTYLHNVKNLSTGWNCRQRKCSKYVTLLWGSKSYLHLTILWMNAHSNPVIITNHVLLFR